MVRLNIAFLRRGIAVGTQHLLTVRGRRSGAPRETPASVVTVAGTRYIVAAFADAQWVRNVQAARAGTLSRGKQTESVALVEIPATERAPVLRAFFAQVRGGRRYFGSQTPDQVVAGADRYPVFRIDPLAG